ncbi:phosphatase PAP2 family protein [Streptomyces arboris]|uniref:phosphatase PAP2 family protein n=1 Tax=Streptomyces arboris TaxID=2600619 RepID=UPI0021F463B9|nr:phosphatase PAP2 family protein [Streptomyces arboris]
MGKQLVDRSRPPKEWFPHDEADDRPDSSSFPSGHTAAAVAFTAAVISPWPTAGAVCVVPAAMVAVERVQSGAHYPSDVVAGATIGLLSAWLTRRAPALLRRRLWQSASCSPSCSGQGTPGPGTLPRHRRYPTFFDAQYIVLAFSLGHMGALGRTYGWMGVDRGECMK